MKKITVFILFLLTGINGFSQTASDAFSADHIIWYGLDFSNSNFIGSFNQFGDAGSKDEDDFRAKYFPAWNILITEEVEKYDIRGAFQKEDITYDLSVVEERNLVKRDDWFSLKTTDSEHLSNADVSKIISEYKTNQNSGVGLVFIVESFDKIKEEASYYVTFFDIATKKVLFTKRLTGKPRGFGLRNYWAGSYHDVIKQCSKEYKRWAKDARKK